jgi:hypothetical protein
MKSRYFLLQVLILFMAGMIFNACQSPGGESNKTVTTVLRAPAYPLITIDPYTSAWSRTDTLFNDAVRHWTGKVHALIGAVRVDGEVYRFLGKEEIPWKALVPMAAYEAWEGRFLLTEPGKGWETADFSDADWKIGKGAFGTRGMEALNTLWETEDIWVRREFAFPENMGPGDLFLIYSHDDIFELYLNGVQLVKTGYEWHNNVILQIDKNLLNQEGKNVIAAHCHNRTGGGLVDFGLFQKSVAGEAFKQTAIQRGVALSATQTHYKFTCGPVDLTLEFVAPLLPADLDLLSRPVNYINYTLQANDDQKHDVQIYFEATPEWAVNHISQEVVVESGETEGVQFLKAGTTQQPVLGRKGDDVRIDWGYFYLSGRKTPSMRFSMGDYAEVKSEFARSGQIPAGPEKIVARMAKSMPVMACTDSLGEVGPQPTSGFVMVGYDDIESIQYFGSNLKGWWTQQGKVTFNEVLVAAEAEHRKIMKKCETFDNKLWKEVMEAGGQKYADLCVLAFRQSIAAHKLVKDTLGNTIFLSKENFSNGSIGTVDLTYPSAPLYLYYNPELLKGMMNPIFYFSESGKWTKPFAAHDVGTYPLANGQTYGGDMPVEESGNMLILATALAVKEGNARYAEQHWEVLTTWADYLLEKGLDPENQLCTDDFAGHFAHNTNLSIKAILGIAGYGRMAEMLGKKEIAQKYTQAAREMAQKWVEMANDGDHFRLTFDKPGTWSQKYNLVWDKILGLDIFPKEVAQKEIAYYLTMQNPYGLPLDNRRTYTKSDWIIWTATLAEDDAAFQSLIAPVHRYVTETPTRVPMSDWYETTNAKQVGFQARSVVGAYFIKLLEK